MGGNNIIKVNGRDFPWEENLTIERIMEIKVYTFPKIYVKVNGELIPKDDYGNTVVKKDDDVQIIHLLAGG